MINMENCRLIRMRSDWKLQLKDFNSPFKHLKVTVTSAQWGDTLFPKKDFSLKKESENFSDPLTKIEFPPSTLLFALVRLVVMLISGLIHGPFFLLAFIYLFAFLILNYQVEDINRFRLEKTACHL
jgi:hypothetical protein